MQKELLLAQKTLFSFDLDKYKQEVIAAVDASLPEVDKIFRPLLERGVENSRNRRERLIEKPNVIEDPRYKQIFTEHVRRVLDPQLLRNLLLDYPHFFGEELFGFEGYSRPIFEENEEFWLTYERMNKHRLNRLKGRQSPTKSAKKAGKFTSQLANISLKLAHPLTSFSELLRANDKETRERTLDAILKSWDVMTEKEFPQYWELVTEKFSFTKYSKQLKYLKDKLSKTNTGSSGYRLGKFSPQQNLSIDIFPKNADSGNGSKLVSVITPKTFHNCGEDIYFFKIESYEKFGEPSSVERHYRSEVEKLRKTLEVLKDSSEIMDNEVETRKKFLENNPEVRGVVGSLEKSGIHVSDEIMKLQYPADVFNYVVGELIPKYNAHNPQITNMFSGFVGKSLDRLRRNKAMESIKSYGAKLSPEEIIACTFVELWSKLRMTQSMNSRIRYFEENLSKVSQYKIKFNHQARN